MSVLITSAKLIAVFVGSYYYVAIIQTGLHRLFGHRNRIRAVFDAHARGHHAKYAPGRLLSDQWVASEVHVLWYYALVAVPMACVIYLFAGPAMLCAHLVGVAAAISWHIYLHQQYHLAHSRWSRFEWFRRKREMHFVHHCEVHKNCAIVEFWIDRLMGTWQEQSPILDRSRERDEHAALRPAGIGKATAVRR